MGAHGHHAVRTLGQREVGRWVDGELRVAVVGVELAFARAVVEVETTWFANAGVEVVEARDRLGDEVADAVVVLDQPTPAHRILGAEHFLGEARDNGGLAVEIRVRGLEVAVRGVDDTHGVLDGHKLRAIRLGIDFGAGEAGQDDRALAVDQVAAVELGGDVHDQVASLERVRGAFGVGAGLQEVTAHREEHLCAPVEHGVDGFDGVEAVLTRGVEAEHFLDAIQERLGGAIVNAHRSVPLDVAVAAHRAGARARHPDAATHQEEVDDFADVADAVLVLGEAHCPAHDRLAAA